MSAGDLEVHFAGLRPGSYVVTSQQSLDYNCVAWAAGIDNRCWWPTTRPLYYWPVHPREESVEGFIRAFETLGYEVCDSADPESGYERVAIYAIGSVPRHMARQLSNGLWTSKCGDLEDITHTLEALEGPEYGRVTAVMRCKQNTPAQP
jgi:hypothetical protein